MSGDALSVPDAYHEEGLIEPFDVDELQVSSRSSSPFARIPHLVDPRGLPRIPVGWSPISIYYNPKFVSPPDSWQVLLDPKYKGRVVVENQPEEIVAYMGKAAGFDDGVQHDRRPARHGQGIP